MQPTLGILDDADAPEARMLVVVYGDPDAPRWDYLDPGARRPRPSPGPRAMPRLFTPLRDFGIAASFEPDGRLRTLRVRAGNATYPDGVPRPWQDRRGGVVGVKPCLASAVLRAVQADRGVADGLEA